MRIRNPRLHGTKNERIKVKSRDQIIDEHVASLVSVHPGLTTREITREVIQVIPEHVGYEMSPGDCEAIRRISRSIARLLDQGAIVAKPNAGPGYRYSPAAGSSEARPFPVGSTLAGGRS